MRRSEVRPPGSSAPPANFLDRAREVSPKLSSATDELNAALGRAEQAIASLKLGVTASVVLDPKNDSDPDQFEVLTFGKEGASWKLLVENGLAGVPETWSATPLTNASREKRLLATTRLPELIERLVAVAEEQIEQVRARAAAVDHLVASIKSSKGAT